MAITLKTRKRLKKLLSVLVGVVFIYVSSIHQAAFLFAQTYGSAIAGKAREYFDRANSGYLSPASVQRSIDKQNAVVDYLNRREGLLDRQQSRLGDKVSANVDQAGLEHQQNASLMRRGAELARQKAFSIFGEKNLFNYALYADGRKVWLRDGNAVRVENERIVDARGNVTLKNTWDMEYNEKKLLVSYSAEETDALGNVTRIRWHGGTYTDDSVFYADDETMAVKNITGYVQETTDADGNTAKIVWSGAAYDGKNLSSYREAYTDARGNLSTRDWSGGKYDGNRQLIEFREVNVDARGNRSERFWTGGTYVKNAAYDEEKALRGEMQGIPEYLLTGYHEEVTDDRGARTVRDWTDAAYDSYGQLVSYREVTTEPSGRRVTTEWTDAEYDRYGRLAFYEEKRTDSGGAATTVRWRADEYSARGRNTAYTETTIDDTGAGTEVRRYGIVYDSVGNVLSYAQDETNDRGAVTRTVWENAAYDAWGGLLGYDETATDPFGGVSSRHWGGAVLDRYGQLLSYRETDTDVLGNETSIVWENAAYNAAGQLTAYRETSTDVLGLTAVKEWSGGTYDAHNRLLSYHEENTDVFGFTTSLDWSAGGEHGEPGYDEHSRLANYTETATNIYGEPCTRYWTDGTYGRGGALAGYTEILVSPDGTARSSRTWGGAAYDDYGRLARYTETWTAENGAAAVHRWEDAEYDDAGRVLRFTESFSDADGSETRCERTSTTWNSLGQITATRETLTEDDGTTTEAAWTAGAFDAYGRVTGFTQSFVNSADPGVTVTTTESGKTFDRYGRQSGGTQRTVTAGRDARGDLINLTVETRLSGVTLHADGSLKSYTQVTETSGLGPGALPLTLTETLAVTGMTTTGWNEERRTVAPGYDHRTQVARTGVRHDRNGVVIAYSDVISDEATPGGTTRVERKFTAFNGKGEVVSYTERGTDINGLVTDQAVGGMIYNGRSQIIGYRQRDTRGQGAETAQETVTRRDLRYDLAARLIRSTEISLSGPTRTVTEWRADAFNAANLVTSETTLTSVRVPGIFAADRVTRSERTALVYNTLGQAVSFNERLTDSRQPDLVTERTVDSITYDSFGQVARQNGEEHTFGRTEQSLPGLEDLNERMLTGAKLLYAGTEVDWDLLTAPQKARLLAGETVTVTVGGADVSLSIADNRACVVVQRVDLTVSTTRDNAVLDARGRVESYRETIVTRASDGAGHFILDRTDVRVRDAIQYDASGRVLSYRDTTYSSETPSLTTVTEVSGMAYDVYGRAVSFTERALRTGTTGGVVTLLVETLTRRTGIRYDGTSDRVASYRETVTRSDAPDETLVTERISTVYDAQGNLAAYTERSSDDRGYTVETTVEDIACNGFGFETGRKETVRTTVEGTGLDTTRVTVTSHVRYNGAGQKVSYVEKTRQDGTDTVAAISWGDARYTLSGLLEGFYQKKTVRNAGGLSTWETLERTATAFNGIGQETATAETLASSEAPGVTAVETTSGIAYTMDGYRRAWRTETLQEARSGLGALTYGLRTVTDRTATAYDGRGQLLSYTEDIAKSSTGAGTAYATSSHVERSVTGYSAARLMTSYEETTVTDGTVTVGTSWTGTYDGNGRLETFVKTDTDVTDPDPSKHFATTTRRLETSYTAAGMQDGYRESVQYPTGLETTAHRLSTSFDTAGRVLGYVEETVSSDQPNILVTTTRSRSAYDDRGLLTAFQEEAVAVETGADGAVVRGPGGTPAQSFVKGSERTATEYNTYGLESSYEERVNNGATGVTTTTGRAAMTYDPKGLLLAYTDTIRERSGDGVIDYTTTVERQSTTYTGRRYAEDYRETRRSARTPGILETVEYDGTVNARGQTERFTKTSFQNLSGALYDLCLTSSRDNITYDGEGRAYSYTEQELSSAEPDVLNDTARAYTTYDGFGGEKTFRQTARRHTAGGSLDVEEETTRTAGQSTVAGFEASFTETLRSSKWPDVTATRTRSGATYRYGMTDGFTESVRRRGTDSLTGRTLDVTLTTARLFTEYDGRGFVKAQKETAVSTAESAVTSTEEYRDIQYDDRGRRTTYTKEEGRASGGGALDYSLITERTAAAYNANGTLAGYTDASVASDSPDVTATVRRSNILYNGRGQETSYDENILRLAQNLLGADTFRQESDVSRTLITYNDQGETASSHDAVTTDFEGNSTKDWAALSFDGFGQLTGTRETGSTPSQGNYTKTTEYGWDALGRQESVTETLDNDCAGRSSTARSVIRYNDRGQAVSYTETGSADETPSYATTFDGSFADAYDAAGRQGHFRETTVTGGITTVRERLSSGYNGTGQLVSYAENAEESAPGLVRTVSAKSWEGEYTVKGALKSTREEESSDIYAWGAAAKSYVETREREWSSPVYDARGFLTSFRETNSAVVRTPDGTLAQQTSGDYTRSAITYDTGRLASYTETGADTAQGDYEKAWAATGFTSSGKASGYTETGYASSGGPNDYSRSNIDYDAQGRLLSYDDYGIAGGKYVKKHWQTASGSYDLLGRPAAFSESGWTENGRFTRNQTLASYDLLGRLVYSAENGCDLSDGNYAKVLSGIRYDANGRRSYYEQTLDQTDTGRRVASAWQVTNGGYNAKGQLTGYRETGTVSEGGSAVEETELAWSALLPDAYAPEGQLARYATTATKTSLVNAVRQVIATERRSTDFAADGRAAGYEETNVTTTSNTADPSQQKVERTGAARSGMTFYTAAEELADGRHREGMLKGYTELQLSSTAAEKPRQVITTGLSYDAATGALSGSTEVSAEEALDSAAIRRFAGWLALTKAGTVMTDAWRQASFELAGLFGGGAALAGRVEAWLDSRSAALTSDPVLWPTRLAALRSFMDGLAGLLSGVNLAAASASLFALVRGQVTDLSAIIDNLALLSASLLPGRPASVLPDVPYAATALAALKPFEYTATVTRRTDLVYDTNRRLTHWREYSHPSSDREIVTVSDVDVTYDGLSSRYATYAARIVETRNVAGVPLSLAAGADAKVTHLFRHAYGYNALGMAESYTETTFEGDTLFTTRDEGGVTTDENVDWRTLANAQRIALVADLLSGAREVRETVTIKRYAGIRYSNELQMADFDLRTDKRGYAFQEFSEAQEMTDSLAKQAEILTAQQAAVSDLLAAVSEARRQWADTAAGTGAYYTARKLYDDTKAAVTAADPSDPALARYFTGAFPPDTDVAGVKAALNDVLSYLVEVEADKEVLVNIAQEDLNLKLEQYNAAKKALDLAVEAFAAANKTWRNADASKGPLGCLVVENTLIAQMKADLLAPQGGTTKLQDDTATLLGYAVTYVQGDPTYGSQYAAITANLTGGRDQVLGVLNNWTMPSPALLAPLADGGDINDWANDLETGLDEVDAVIAWATALDSGLSRMLAGTTALASVIDRRSNTISGVTGDILQDMNDKYAAMVAARSTYATEYQELYGTGNAATEDGAAPAGPAGGLLLVKNNADNAVATTLYTGADPYNDVTDGATLGTAVGQLSTRLAYYRAKKAEYDGYATANYNNLNAYRNVNLWHDTDREWNYCCFKYDYWYYDIWLHASGNEFAFYYNDDGTYYYVSGDTALWISDNDGDVVYCNNQLNALRSNRSSASTYNNKANTLQPLYDEADRRYDELLLAQTNATTAYNDQVALVGTKYADYDAKRTLYNAARARYDQARLDLKFTAGDAASAGQKQKFSGYSGRAAENMAALDPASDALAQKVGDMKARTFAFDAATTALNNSRTAFRNAMDVFTAATARKDDAETKVGGLLDALAGLERIQGDLACEQDTETLIAADGGTLAQDIAAQLRKHEFLVGGAVQTISAAQAADLAAGNSITFAGLSLDLGGLLVKLKNDAKVKISASQTTTTARRNMTYDALGYLKTYDELAFTGTDIVWNGTTVSWDSLTAAQKNSVFGAAPPSIALTGAGALTVTRGLDHAYDGEGKLVSSVVNTRETRKREGSSDTYTHEYRVTTSGIEYAGAGNIKRYVKTTVDGLRTTVEETTDDLRYDLEDQLVESKLRTTETVRLADGTLVYSRARDAHTSGIVYNDLGHMTGYLRVTDDAGKITVEKTIGAAAYNRQGQLVYSHNRVVETNAADLAAVLAQIAVGAPTTGKITEVIVRDAEYDSRDMATKLTRTVIEGDKRTDEVVTMSYDAGRLRTSASAVRESAVTSSGKLFYRSYQVSQDITSYYNDSELAAAQVRTTTEGTKVTAETSSAMAYDTSGRLVHSLVQLQESFNGAAAPGSSVETTVHGYDAANNVAYQTRVTRESGKTVTETNWDAAADGGAGAPLFAAMTYADGNLLTRKMRVTEKGEDPNTHATVYEKTYVQAESFQLYDSIGQLLKYVKNTEVTDASTGDRTNTEETTTNEYNIRGHIRESSVVRNKYENGAAAAGKKTTQVTRITPSGYNSSNQMENYTSVTFDGDRVQIDRVAGGAPARVKLAWTDLSEAEKRALINGEYKAAHDDIVAVTFMNGVSYDANRMASWTATTRTLGPITVGLQTLLTSTFKGVDLSPAVDVVIKESLFDQTIGKGTIITTLSGAIQASALTQAQKLDLMHAIRDDVPVPRSVLGEDLVDASNNELVKIRVPMDTTSVTVRRATSYDAWDRLTGYDEINLEGRGIFLGGVFHDWNAFTAQEQEDLIAEWDHCLSVKPDRVTRAEAALLPNNFVTRTKMWGMTYTGQNELQGYMTSKHELQLIFSDMRADLASPDVPLTINRVTRSARSETVKNALGQEIAVKETVINPNNSGTESWTFYAYQDGKAKELLKLSELVSEDNLGVITHSNQWTMEDTVVGEYTSLAGVDLFKKIGTVTTRGIEVTNALKNQTLKAFVETTCGGNMNQFKLNGYTLLPTAITEEDELTFEYVYDPISNAPVVSRTTRLHRDVDDIPTIDDTYYYYARSDTKPSHIRTVTVNAPGTTGTGPLAALADWNGAGIITREDSVLEYNASGLVKRTTAVKKDAGGVLSREVVEYAYALTGQVERTVKSLTQDIAGNLTAVQNGDSSSYEKALPINFLFYDGGGVTTAETSYFTYYNDNRIKTTDVVRTGLTGARSAEHNRYFYNALSGRLDSSVTVTLEGADDRTDLDDIVDLDDAVITDPGAAAAASALASSAFAWDYSRRSDISYDPDNAFMAGYTGRSVSSDAPGKITVETASGMAYDPVNGRMTARTTWSEERRLSDNALIGKSRTEFSAPTYDALGRLTHYTQRTVSDADGDGTVVLNDDKTVTEVITQGFSSSDGRVILSEKTITERGASGAAALNHTYTTKTEVKAFDAACPALPSVEVTTTYEDNRVTSEEAAVTYDAVTRRVVSRDVKTTVTETGGTLNSLSRTHIAFAGYDDLGRAADYTVTSTKDGRRTVQRIHDISYDAAGQVTGQRSDFTETIVSGMPAYLREWSTVTSLQGWDKLGLMTSGHRETEERGKRTVEDASGMTYDAAGRLAGSRIGTREVDIAGSGGTDGLLYNRRYDVTAVNTYDLRGLLTGVSRTTEEYGTADGADAGAEIVVKNIMETTAITYDERERASVTETETVETDDEAVPGTKHADRYSLRTGNSYDFTTGLADQIIRTRKDNYRSADGLYHRQSQEVVADIGYDQYGRMAHSMSQFTETNLVPADGTLNKSYRVVTDNTFDDLDRAARYTRTTIEGMTTTTESATQDLTYYLRGNIKKTVLHILEESSDGAVDSDTTAATEYTDYDAWGRAEAYTKTTLDREMKTVETASGLAYHPSGQLRESFSSFRLTDVHSGGVPPEGTELDRSWTVDTDHIDYTNLGFIRDYVKTTVENGKTTVETMDPYATGTSTTYDAGGRMKGSTVRYRETAAAVTCVDTAPEPDVTYTTPPLDHTWTATTANASYSGAGQMAYYEKTVTDGTKSTAEKTYVTYTAGRAAATDTQYTETDSAPGALLNHTYTVRMSNTYNGYDRVTGYDRTTIDGQTTLEQARGQTYNAAGQVLSYTKETTVGEKKTTDAIVGAIQYDALGRVIYTEIHRRETDTNTALDRLDDQSTVKSRYLQFDALGRVVRYHTVTESKNFASGNRTVDDITTADMTYNSAGQLATVAYDRTETGALSDAATVTVNDGTADTDVAVGSLDVKSSISVSYDSYGANGQAKTMTRTTVSGPRETSETVSMAYDACTNLLSSSETDSREHEADDTDDALNVNTTVRLSGMSYDTLGRVAGMTRETFMGGDAAADGKKTLETVISQTYDRYGRLKGSTALVYETSAYLGLNHSYRQVVDIQSYNPLGQVTKQQVTASLDSGAPDRVTVMTQSENRYDEDGRLFSFTQVSQNNAMTAMNLYSERAWTLYNTFDQALKYKDTSWKLAASVQEMDKLLDGDATNGEMTAGSISFGSYLDSLGNALSNVTIADILGRLNDAEPYTDGTTNLAKMKLAQVFEGLIRAGLTAAGVTADSAASATSAVMTDLGAMLVTNNAGEQRSLSGMTLPELLFFLVGSHWDSFTATVTSGGDTDTTPLGNLTPGQVSDISAAAYTIGATEVRNMELKSVLDAIMVQAFMTHSGLSQEDAETLVAHLQYRVMARDAAGAPLDVTESLVKDITDTSVTVRSFLDLIKTAVFSGTNAQDPDDLAQEVYDHFDTAWNALTTDAPSSSPVGPMTLASIRAAAAGTVLIGGADAREMTLRQAVEAVLIAAYKSKDGLTDAEAAEAVGELRYDIAAAGGASLLSTKIKDIADAGALSKTILELIRYDVLNERTVSNAREIFEKAMKTEVQNLTLSGGGAAIGTAGMAALLFNRFGVAGATLADRIINALKATYSVAGYQDATKVVSTVSNALYDAKDRLVGTTESRTWNQAGGGNIPGLDTQWRNGSVTVAMSRSFKGATDELFNQCYYAQGTGTNLDPVINVSNEIRHGYLQTGFDGAGNQIGIQYDEHGRDADSWTMTAQRQKFTYVYLDTNWLGELLDLSWKPEEVKDQVSKLATITHMEVMRFDNYGRTVDSDSAYRRDDGNRTRGTDKVRNTAYDAEGKVAGSISEGNTEMRRLKDDGGDQDDPFGSCNTGYIANNWLFSTEWTLGKSAGLKTRYDSLYVDENSCGSGSRNNNQYQYDIYGNVDQEATEELSTKDSWTTFDHGSGLTSLGLGLLIAVIVASIVIGVATSGVGTAIATAAISTFLTSSITGASVQNALVNAAISAAFAGMAAHYMKGVQSMKGLAYASRWAATKVANVGGAFLTQYAIGTTGNPLAGPATINPQALGMGSVLTAAKVSMVIAMNVGAAEGEGASSGKMLQLAANAATGSLTGTNGTSRQAASRNITRTLSSAQRQFMAVLSKAVVVKLTEQGDDDSGLSMGSALVQLAAGMANRVMTAAAQRSAAQRSETASEQRGGQEDGARKNAGGRETGGRSDRVEGPVTGAEAARAAVSATGSDAGGSSRREAGYGSVTDRLSQAVTAALGAAISALGAAAGYDSSLSAGAGLAPSGADKDDAAPGESPYSSQDRSAGAGDEKKMDVSHMATGTGEKDSAGVMYFGQREQAGNTSYSEKKNILEGLGIKVDNNILEGYFGSKAIADMKELLGAQKIDFDTVIGARVNGREMALFFKDDTLVAAGMVNASGQKEVRTFSFKLDEEGKVSVASGKIFREIAGKYVEVGAFVYAVQGSKEYQQAMARAEELVQSGEALAKVKAANAVYTETDVAGNMTRRIYLKTDEAGNAVVLAAEIKAGDGKFKLLTYDDGIKSGGQGGLLAKGKVYEQETNGKYGKEAAGSFEIREMAGTANLSVNKSVAQALALGQNSRIVYKEQMKSGALREVSMNKETGQLEYVYTVDASGNKSVIAFGGAKNQTVDGVAVTNFNTLSREQQNDVLASLPVMDSRDPSTVTAKLVGMQNELYRQRLQKLADQRGWKLDAEKGQIFMKIPGGEGVQVMRMGEDRGGDLIIEGRVLVASEDGGLAPSGREVYMAPAQSAFAGDLYPGTGARPAAELRGCSLVAVVDGKTTKVSVLDSQENVLRSEDVPTGQLKRAIENLKAQDPEAVKRGISARLLEGMKTSFTVMRNAFQNLKLFR